MHKGIIKNGLNLGKLLFEKFNLDGNIYWLSSSVNFKYPFDIKIGDTGISLKEDSYILKNPSPSIIKRDKKSLGLQEDNKRLVLLEKDVLRISGSFEFMKVEEAIIILTNKGLGVLQREFGFDKIIKQKANIYIDKIKASGLLADIKDIQGVADDVSFAKKIMNIKVTSKVLELKPKTVVNFCITASKVEQEV